MHSIHTEAFSATEEYASGKRRVDMARARRRLAPTALVDARLQATVRGGEAWYPHTMALHGGVCTAGKLPTTWGDLQAVAAATVSASESEYPQPCAAEPGTLVLVASRGAVACHMLSISPGLPGGLALLYEEPARPAAPSGSTLSAGLPVSLLCLCRRARLVAPGMSWLCSSVPRAAQAAGAAG